MSGCMTSHLAETSVPTVFAELLRRIESGSATIGICGLGYVGLPLAKAAVEGSNFRIIGFDTDGDKIRRLNSRQSYIRHVTSAMIAHMADTRRFEATDDFNRIAELDAVLICVPTPLSKYREPDLSFVVDTARTIARNARPGQLIILESTTYPGTTRDVLKPIFEERGLSDGEDIFLAFSPERQDPGNSRYDTANIPKIVGADDDRARILATKLYGAFIERIIPVSSSAAAEAIKLTENIFRAVNIALVNELKVIFTPMGIDIWEVIAGAQTKPFGFMPFYPGPGLGGHCIPIDPFYLTWKAREFGISTRFIELAGEINIHMPYFVREKVVRALNETGRPLKDADILVLGVAYKKDIEDWRESPAVKVMELLDRDGANLEYHDPFVPKFEDHKGKLRHSVPLSPERLQKADLVLILTNHSNVDYAKVIEHSRAIVDTRNATSGIRDGHDNVVML